MSAPEPPVLVLGPSAWNTMILLDRLPEARPHTEFARASWDTVGGTSAGKALHLTDLGVPVRLLTPLADDEPGRRVRAALAGVAVEPLPSDHSERHVNLMTPEGDRLSIYTVPPAEATLPDVDALRGAPAVVVDLAPWTRELVDGLTRDELPIWCDLHDVPEAYDWHAPFVRAASYVQCSSENLPRPLDFLRARVADGARLAVCTLGARGAVAVDADGEHDVAAVPCDVVDTNGAGDAFFAGVLAATLRGEGTEAALRAGAEQATRAVTTRDLGPGIIR